MPSKKLSVAAPELPPAEYPVITRPDDILGFVLADGVIRAIYRKHGRLDSAAIDRIRLSQG